MGQRYNQQQSSNSLQKATFLPMLCSRPSIKNVTIPKSVDYSSSSCSSPLSHLQEDHHHDPLSPKISCVGQVKRHNKIIGFPTTNHNHNHNHNKLAMVTTKNHSHYYTTYHMIPYLKLKRFFSSKSLTTTTTTTRVTPTKTDNNSNSNSSGRRRRGRGGELMKKGELEKGSSKDDERSEKGVMINVVDLDPPLPVIKKKQEASQKTENLWKRRSGGLELGSLQLQRVRPNLQHQMMQLTTV